MQLAIGDAYFWATIASEDMWRFTPARRSMAARANTLIRGDALA